MPRTPEYDREQVLEAAMKVFWRDGYEAASMQNLIHTMGINRGSLYQAFDSKAGLFGEVLGHYVNHFQPRITRLIRNVESEANALPESDAKPETDIHSVLYAMFLVEHDEYDSWGCLLFNTVSELKNTRPELAEQAEKYLLELKSMFESYIKKSQREERMRKDQKASVMADYLITLCGGLRLAEKMNRGKSELKSMIDIGLESLLSRPLPPTQEFPR